VEAATAAGIDRQYWNRLQKGNTIELEDGRVFTPDMVLGETRKGLKLTYTTDSRPTDSIVENAKDSDLFICEGMYGEPDKLDKAKEHKHMTFYEAAQMAKRAKVKEMWLTHYSPSLTNPREYKSQVREIFSNTIQLKMSMVGRHIRAMKMNFGMRNVNICAIVKLAVIFMER
jgi:ribonuclease Z